MVIESAYCDAEEAAEEAIDCLLQSGATVLYRKYIDEKCFAYAARATGDALWAQLCADFISIDPGNLCEEDRISGAEFAASVAASEPPRLLVDAWAKSAVPMRVRPPPVVVAPVVVPSAPTPPPPARRVQTPQPPAPVVSPVTRRAPVVDDQERQMRQVKERIAKQVKEEETQQRRQAQVETDSIARAVQVKSELRNKTFSHDAEGNLVWIESAPVNDKLPLSSAHPLTKSTYSPRTPHPPPLPRVKMSSVVGAVAAVENVSPHNPPSVAAPPASGFRKLNTVQPAATSVLPVKPGVTLSEKGQTVKGPNVSRLGADGVALMTTTEYEQLAGIASASNPRAKMVAALTKPVTPKK